MKRGISVFLLGAWVLGGVSWQALANSPATGEISLKTPPSSVLDGDTFEADLDGNGKLDLPTERVRLLYVDTPEIHASNKGLDLRHGLPAKAALAEILARGPVVLKITPGNERDLYGRTLARVYVGTTDVSLELIRQGHSYYMTQYAIPRDHESFVQAEVEAYDNQRGIWRETNSRQAYLERLRKEGRTPESKENALFVPQVFQAQALDEAANLGKYVKVEGYIAETRKLQGGHQLLRLLGGGSKRPLAAFVSSAASKRIGIAQWPPRSWVQVEGFLERYQGRIELKVHLGFIKSQGAGAKSNP